MIVAGLVVETTAGAARSVAARLARVPGLEVPGTDERQRIAVVWSAADGEALERAAEDLVRGDEEILGVYPTYVGAG